MSQTSFAKYLKIGEASIKRWETYYIQDASQDDHIRVKCETDYAELNFVNVSWTKEKPSVFNGNRRFNLSLFNQVVLYFLDLNEMPAHILNKLMFYTDFIHFRKYGKSITGSRYKCTKYGPSPDRFRLIYDRMIAKELIQSNGNFKSLVKPNLNYFDAKEHETLQKIKETQNKLGKEKFYELAREEKGFLLTDEAEFISYEYAKDLLIH